jgi:hypothetical protein
MGDVVVLVERTLTDPGQLGMAPSGAENVRLDHRRALVRHLHELIFGLFFIVLKVTYFLLKFWSFYNLFKISCSTFDMFLVYIFF